MTLARSGRDCAYCESPTAERDEFGIALCGRHAREWQQAKVNAEKHPPKLVADAAAEILDRLRRP